MKEKDIIKILKASASDTQLICFPYVGGAATGFAETAAMITSDIEVLAVNPPGHGPDILGSPLKTIDEMAGFFLPVLEKKMKKKVYLLGYSLGAYVAYKICVLLAKKGSPVIPSVIIAASNAPHIINSIDNHSEKDDDDFFTFLKSIGGIPPRLEQRPGLIPMFLEIYRTDFQAAENFKAEPYLLDNPVYLIYGKHDTFASPQTIVEWQDYFSCRMTHYKINGPHMFIKDLPGDLAQSIDTILQNS